MADSVRKATNCPNCEKKIPEDDANMIGCEGNCKDWYHRECAGITVTEYNALKTKKGNLLWMCGKCRSLLEVYGINTCPPEIAIVTETALENKNACNQIKKKMEEMEEVLLQKMSLLLDTQVQQAEMLLQNERVYRKNPVNILYNQQENKIANLNKDPRVNISQPTLTQHSGAIPTVPVINKYRGNERTQQEAKDTTVHPEPKLDNTDSELFTDVVRKRRNGPKEQIITGASTNTDAEIRTGTRNAWLHIGKLHETTTTENMENYLRKQGITDIRECEILSSKGTLKSFKIGIPFEDLEKTNCAEFWPKGVTVRRYHFRRNRDTGAVLQE